MKKNEGFTLVEVLAAVVVLLMIIVIITPKVFKQLKTAENVTDQEQINAIINTAKLYMNQNTELLPEDDSVYIISLEELKDSGLIKKEQIQNPSTKQELTGCITVQQQNNKYKYEYEDDPTTCNQITVTFDPNGGTVDQTSKNVIIGQKYRSLPTPTKEGYTFLGWNGKNLFNKNSKPYKTKYWVNNAGEATNEWSIPFNIYEVDIKPNTQYTITNSGEADAPGYAFYDENRNYISGARYSKRKNITFTTPSNAAYIRLSVGANSSQYNHLYDIDFFQLEEGNTATTYDPYYITNDTIVVQESNHTLKSIWVKDEATFLTGILFNTKIKQLAGTPSASYNTYDANIESIIRASTLPSFVTGDNIVSTDTLNKPIYAWFDNGTIYYYTEALNLYTNDDASYMFYNLKNLRNLDISTLDTTRTTNMAWMFVRVPKMEIIDVSNFDTSNVTSMYAMFSQYDSGITPVLREITFGENFKTNKVTNMRSMFAGCSNLTSIDLSTFDTSNVTTMYHMFTATPKIEKLDLSTFDMSKVTDTDEFISYLTSLQELKTPKAYPSNTNITIALPKIMYDENNNAYQTLRSGSPTETLLKNTQTN